MQKLRFIFRYLLTADSGRLIAFLHVTIPLVAIGAFSHPFGGLGTAILAGINGFGFGHRLCPNKSLRGRQPDSRLSSPRKRGFSGSKWIPAFDGVTSRIILESG